MSAPNDGDRAGERRVYLGLGSNMGDRDALLAAALSRLAGIARITRRSSIWDSAPMLVEDQPRFHNMAVEAWTRLDPFALLAAVKRIERELGREPGPRYGPRPIDIDILLYDDLTLNTPALTIPHARLLERAFALVPLAEIAPGAWHPVARRTAAALAAAAPAGDLRLVAPPPA